MNGQCSSSIAAGWTSCAVGAMSLLGKLPDRNTINQTTTAWPTAESIERLLGWLVSRQTSIFRDEEKSHPAAVTGTDIPTGGDRVQASVQAEDHVVVTPNSASPRESGMEPADGASRQVAGFTGRCNKAADTCYAFWAGGSLKVRVSLSCMKEGSF